MESSDAVESRTCGDVMVKTALLEEHSSIPSRPPKTVAGRMLCGGSSRGLGGR